MQQSNFLSEALEITVSKVNKLLSCKNSVIVAIDGRSASGKSTFAQMLSGRLSALVLHMDDFFLRPEQRTIERLNTPGGNVDRERFLSEVLIPLKDSDTFLYRPYDCHTGAFRESIEISPRNVTIVEGSYSCHPELFNFYDLHIFLDVDADVQLERLICREGKDKAETFKNKWVPLEEKYFSFYKIMDKCDLIYKI